MKINTLKFKKLNTIVAIIPLFLLIACQSEVKPVTTTVPKTTTPKSSQVVAQPQPQDYSEFVDTLQGSWERTTYPYGKVEFQNDKVKFTEGEGSIKDSKFESFKVADECPVASKAEASALAYDFLVVSDKYCDAIKLNGDTLSIIYSDLKDSIEYKRIDKGNTTTASVAKDIPVNFRGKWAIGKENCKADNLEQIQISANKINFFKNEAKLVAITQFEPTRLEADFNYMISNSDSTPYSYTLDLQNQEKVLIMREDGDNSRPGPIKYEKCA